MLTASLTLLGSMFKVSLSTSTKFNLNPYCCNGKNVVEIEEILETINKLSEKHPGKYSTILHLISNKGKDHKVLSNKLVFNIEPETLETANVVLGNINNIPSIVVDTHVTRISNLLNLSSSSNAVIIEKNLEKLVPKDDWIIFTHLVIDHGRAVCIARRPQCNHCSISVYCPSKKQ